MVVNTSKKPVVSRLVGAALVCVKAPAGESSVARFTVVGEYVD